MEDAWVGIGFLILVLIIGLITTLVQFNKRLKLLEGKNKTLKQLEEHVIKMSELVIQNNEFIASRLRMLENKGVLSRDDIDKIKEYLGMKK